MSASETNNASGEEGEPAAPKITKLIAPKLAACIIESVHGVEVDKNGRYEGNGKVIFREGNVYQGDWLSGLMHGKGEYKWKDGSQYVGDFKENEITGKGSFQWSNGSSYEGEFVRGIRHGTGEMILATRQAYEGGWQNGKRHGEGTLYYDGEQKTSYYRGGWHAGKRCGRGNIVYATGNSYDGEWKDDKKHGMGKMLWGTSNEAYNGEWADDKPHGQGEHVWLGERTKFAGTERQMCNRYVGNFVAGKREGQGSFYFSNGSRYTGEFKNNQKHGHGVYTFPDGRVYEGPFVEDRMAYTDVALEEKSPTKGPIKSPQKSKGKKSNSVLAGTSRNVQLNVSDLMPNLAPLELLKERRSIDNVVMRWNTDLKRIYNDYSTKVVGPNAASAPNTFTMSLAQFWRFSRDCDLISRPLPLTVIDRCFHETRVQLASAVVMARRRREAAERGVPEDQVPTTSDSLYLEDESNIHAPEHPILFREFVEVLARIAHRIYDNVKPLLSEKLQLLLSTKVGRERTPATEEITRDDINGDLVRPNKKMTSFLRKHDAYLKDLFDKYCHDGIEIGKADRSMYVRDFAKMLQHCGIVYTQDISKSRVDATEEEIGRRQTISMTTATQEYLKSRYATPDLSSRNDPETENMIIGSGESVDIVYEFDEEDDESNFDYELLYSEFLESLSRVGFKWHEARLVEQARLEKEDEEKNAAEAGEEQQEDGEKDAEAESKEVEAAKPSEKPKLPAVSRLSTLGSLRRILEDGIMPKLTMA